MDPGETTAVQVTDVDVPAGWRLAGAAILAHRLGPAVAMVRAGGAAGAGDDPAAVQHVTADGRLVPNGVLWLERSGLPFRIDAAAAPGAAWIETAGRPADLPARLVCRVEGRRLSVRDAETARQVASADLDRYGRPASERPRDGTPAGGPAGLKDDDARAPARILVVGAEERLRSVYPAVVAALGDASDALGRPVRIAHAASAAEAVADRSVDGIVLPGGPDMGEVPALVEAAGLARRGSLPVLGLCLGMQAICLEIARAAADMPDAALEEIDPAAPVPLFRRLVGPDGDPRHRLGDRPVRLARACGIAPFFRRAGAALAWTERMNHRFALDRDRLPALAAAGLDVAARDPHEGTVDVVAIRGHPFAAGLQGHPELASRPGAPHPAFAAFLARLGPPG